MKIPIHPVTLDDLMAYVDGQLEPDQRQKVEAAINTDALIAASVIEMQAQRQALHHQFDAVLNEPIPSRLLVGKRGDSAAWLRVASIVAWVVAGAVIGSAFTAYYPAQTTAQLIVNGDGVDLPRFVHQAVVAHMAYAPDVRHPVEIYSAQEQQLVSWLSLRLGRQLKVPNLASAGFHLVGGRLLPGEVHKSAAQFMYENAAGQRITLYLRGMAQPTPETAFRFAERDGVATFYWVDRDWGYALSSDLPHAALRNAASSVYQQLVG